MDFIQTLSQEIAVGLEKLYGLTNVESRIQLSQTRKEFEGDYTVVIFPFVKDAKKSPVQVGEELGGYIVEQVDFVESYNVIKGFLNFSFSVAWWRTTFDRILADGSYGVAQKNGQKVMVEFCSPNTNKPLHLGHIRNILLGWSCSQILDAAGYEVIKTQIINDRGIAVCKSMLAWQKFADGATPESTGTKGDHFVGQYYVRFDKEFQAEYHSWQESAEGQSLYSAKAKEGQDADSFFKAYKNTYFNEYSSLGADAKAMLLKWEAGDEDVRKLWQQLNDWVYEGFGATYDALGVDFDKLYYESDTYLLGKSAVDIGLEKGVFDQDADGSVWCDLSDIGMDRKIVLRADGTAVYMTQDIGTAMIRNQDFGVESMVYVVGDEQDYHFKVLFEILKRLGEPYAEHLYHLSYGMVDLPTGRMKSREGTVVDADDLVKEVILEASKATDERGEMGMLNEGEKEEVLRKIGLAALKYFIIKVHPKKRMVFNPADSVDMQGQTGPYIQNAYVRIQSVLRKYDAAGVQKNDYVAINEWEMALIKALLIYPDTVQQAATDYDPSHIASYCYELAKMYHRFYHEVRILTAETESAKAFRLDLSSSVARTLQHGMKLLGIDMPERM